ncbi:MAG: hypothetical protein JO069_19505 [Verrucomicrobia bacterium]|nr:hypothetical protein [Verrucomicrobiota bacterium]
MFEPLEIPDPFHPAVAHYPVVLTLLGTLFALGACFTRRMNLPFWTFLVLLLATISAYLAVITGTQESVGTLAPAVSAMVQQHIEWGRRTRTFDLITTGFALLGLLAFRLPRVRRYVAVMTLALGVFTSYSVLRAAEHGRKLVYDYAVGVATPAPTPRSSPSPDATATPAASAGANPTAAAVR